MLSVALAGLLLVAGASLAALDAFPPRDDERPPDTSTPVEDPDVREASTAGVGDAAPPTQEQVEGYTVAAASSLDSSTIDDTLDSDVTPPTVTITKPDDGQVSGPQWIEWTTLDVNKDRVEIQVRAADATDWTTIHSGPDDGNHSWDTTGTSDGNVTLRVVAYDTADNSGNDTANLTVENQGPAIQVESPSDGATLSSSPSSVQGSASDVATSVDEVRLVLHDASRDRYWNASTSTWASTSQTNVLAGTTSWSMSLPTLDDGSYEVTLQAEDSAGHLATATVSFSVRTSSSGGGSGGGSGGSGGGGGGSGTDPANDGGTGTHGDDGVPGNRFPGAEVVREIGPLDADSAVRVQAQGTLLEEVTVRLAVARSNVTLVVDQLDAANLSARGIEGPATDDVIHAYIDVSLHDDDGPIPDADLSNVTLRAWVDPADLEGQSLDPNTVRWHHYADGEWTSFAAEPQGNGSYLGETTSLSPFALGFREASADAGPAPQGALVVVLTVLGLVGAAVAGAIVIALYTTRRPRR